MATQRSRPRRGGRHTVSKFRFSLRRFEADLRSALEHQDERLPGTPGSSTPDFTGSTSRALKSWLFSCLLSKYDPGTGGQLKRDAAMEKFWIAEEKCFWSNLFFCQSRQDIDKRVPLLAKAREAIHRLLGPELPLQEISRGFGHGPGATTRLPRLTGDAVYKYSTEVEVTPNALPLGTAAILAEPLWKQMFSIEDGGLPNVTTTWGNRVTTVPKNYKSDRVIAIEPDLNMYVQKGLGAVLRRRLKKVGVDLDDQSLNQEAAKDLSNATIDFSMASDLVSQGLVNYLLPENWRDFIADSRSEWGVLDGALHRYSKVSSMGNGFTFELESLIFWALAQAVVPEDRHNRIRVYGDDVIIPRENAHAFMDLAQISGFIPNYDKSFWEGPFRESCGKHYFNGCDISPFYIKEPVNTLDRLFLLHNNLWRWLQRVDSVLEPRCYAAVKRLLQGLRNLAPAKWRRPSIPDGYGDDAFIGSFAECNPRTCSRGWESFECRVFTHRPKTRPYQGEYPGVRGRDRIVDLIEVPDGSIWVKADKIMRQRRWILPQVYSLDVTANVAPRSKRANAILRVPWWAWG